MAKARPSHLEQAAIAVTALLAAVDSAVRGIFHQGRVDADSLEQGKSKSASRAIPAPNESAERCPPSRGRLVTRRWHMSPVSRDYQARVTGFVPTTEWEFQKIEFDGFRPPECLLQEAKARYDQFFDPKTGKPKKFFVKFGAVANTLSQARAQSRVVRNNPPTKLTWYFMQPLSHRYFTDLFARENLAIVSILYL
jgi:hypothetical protein